MTGTSAHSAPETSEVDWTEPELVGNALCLDFANTVNSHVNPTHDWIAQPRDLTKWARHVGLDSRPAGSLTQVHELRESIYRIFSAVAANEQPAPADLNRLTATYAEAVRAAHLRPVAVAHRNHSTANPRDIQRRITDTVDRSGGAGEAAYGLEWRDVTADRHVRWAVADSAMALLRRGPLERLGECPSCRWLFLDTSRNGRRRWCSMATCGSRVKSARHYASRR